MEPYRFRPFTHADFANGCAMAPNIGGRAMVGDPNEELALLTQDLDEPLMHQWIVEHDSRPFAYIQAYQVECRRMRGARAARIATSPKATTPPQKRRY
jgi:hypothetical protein